MKENDLSFYDFNGVNIVGTVFGKGCVLPKDRNFLKNVCNASIHTTIFDSYDLSEYDFTDVLIKDAKFSGHCFLPKDENLFLNVKDRDISGCHFYNLDLSMYNFNDVDVESVYFYGETKLPNINTFIGSIKNTRLKDIMFPKGDYNYWIVDRNKIYEEISFSFDSILPEYSSFIKDILCGLRDKPYLSEFCYLNILTRNVVQNIHKYDLNGVKIDLNDFAGTLEDKQIAYLNIRYRDEICKNILLP